MAASDMSGVAAAVNAAVGQLISVSHLRDSSFINLPLIYPGGDFVTVKVERAAGSFRVSDSGFAYREAESLGAERSFARIATQAIEGENLLRNSRSIYADVPIEDLERAICDVAVASWRVADRLCTHIEDDEESEELTETLTARLSAIFGIHSVQPSQKLIGASTSPWTVTATVKHDNALSAFQMVTPKPYSIYRTSSAFGDLADLDFPPRLIAVVQDRKLFGSKLALLSRSGRVIEQQQPNETYIRAAA